MGIGIRSYKETLQGALDRLRAGTGVETRSGDGIGCGARAEDI